MKLFLNSDHTLSVVRGNVLIVVPIGAASVREVMALLNAGHRADATVGDQITSRAIESLLGAITHADLTIGNFHEMERKGDPRALPGVYPDCGIGVRAYL